MFAGRLCVDVTSPHLWRCGDHWLVQPPAPTPGLACGVHRSRLGSIAIGVAALLAVALTSCGSLGGGDRYTDTLQRFRDADGLKNKIVKLPGGDRFSVGSPDGHDLVVQRYDADSKAWSPPKTVATDRQWTHDVRLVARTGHRRDLRGLLARAGARRGLLTRPHRGSCLFGAGLQPRTPVHRHDYRPTSVPTGPTSRSLSRTQLRDLGRRRAGAVSESPGCRAASSTAHTWRRTPRSVR